jgi:hypothetical protein
MSDIPREFVFTRYPARQGMVWLRMAYVLFSKHRASWIVVFVGYSLITTVISVVPYLGGPLAAVAHPLLAVGILAAAWNEERGAPPALSHLLQGFHSNVWALIGVGAAFFVAMTLAVYGSFFIFGQMQELSGANAPKTHEEVIARLAANPRLQMALLLSIAVSAVLWVVSWWAAALVVFQDATAGAAIATSLRASMANWRAIIVYLLALVMYGGFVPLAISVIVALVVPPSVLLILVIALVLPYVLMFALTMYVSYYVSYRDVFHANETLAPLTRG